MRIEVKADRALIDFYDFIRIENGSFELNQKVHQLNCNQKPHTLHGGPTGYSFRVFTKERQWKHGNDEESVTYQLIDEDGHEGFPGRLLVQITYTLNGQDDTLSMEYRVRPDGLPAERHPTIVNLTNHTYFNLSGGLEKTIYNHQLHLPAVTGLLEMDKTLIPTGRILSVKDPKWQSNFDFSKPREIKDAIQGLETGYDHCYLVQDLSEPAQPNTESHLHSQPPVRHVATLFAPITGIQMQVHTTEPAFQLYSGYWVGPATPDSKPAKPQSQPESFLLDRYSGICVETQRPANAINRPEWKQWVILGDDEEAVYFQRTEFRFRVQQ